MAHNYTIRLLRRVEVAEGTAAFHFERPPRFEFLAGQFLDMDLSPYVSGEPAAVTHSFSIASAPYEDELVVATRLRDSAFKRTLASLPSGAEVQIEGPFGSFVPQTTAGRPLVAIAGGIGITPFRSIVRQFAHEGRLDDVYLFYSNRTPLEAAFLDELMQLAQIHAGFKLICTVTAETAEGLAWSGERGRITLEMLSRYVDPLAATHYLAGPPALVEAMRALLRQAGVERGHVHVERFQGY